ncbi:MAG: hypothetical protein NVS4B13_02700 [Candidatus Elarobacter sp.]
MLNRTPRAAAVTAVTALFLGSLGLSGCSTGSNATVTHTPALKTVGGRATARGSVQAAILVVDTANGIALPGGPTPASLTRRVFAIVHGNRTTAATGAATGTCSNGVKSSQVTNSDGSRSTTTDYFYEPACTTLESEQIIVVQKPSTPTNTTGSGTITSYDRTGGVRVVETLTLKTSTDPASSNPNQETFTLSETAATSAGGTTVAAFGVTCIGVPGSATLTCSGAHYGTSAGTTTGEAFSTNATASTTGGNANATIGVAFYTSSTLGLAQSGVLWGITGANAFNSATGTYGYSSTGPSGNGTLTLKDVLYTYNETATLSPTGLSISIIQNPNAAVAVATPIAIATVDVAGTGVLTYADGTTEPIAGGLIGF